MYVLIDFACSPDKSTTKYFKATLREVRFGSVYLFEKGSMKITLFIALLILTIQSLQAS